MLEKYFPKDICSIIYEKLQTNYTQYKVWCCYEYKWLYVWLEDGDVLVCPNGKNHILYKPFTKIIDTFVTKNNMYIREIKDNNNIVETTFMKSYI